MNVCSKCNKELQDDAQFCDNCGTPITKTEVNAGSNEASTNEKVNAGSNEASTEAKVNAEDNEASTNEKVNAESNETSTNAKVNEGSNEASAKAKVNAENNQAPQKKSLLIPILIGAGVLVLLLIVAAAAFMMKSGSSDSKNKGVARALYVKDRQLYVSDLSNKAPLELTSNLASGQDNSEIIEYTNYYMNYSIHFSKNGNTIFYPDKFDGESYTLYCKDITKPKKEAIKIDSGVSGEFPYYVSSDNNTITYVKRNDNTIYQYDMKKKEKTKIDSGLRDFIDFYAEDGGKQILYIKEDGDLYLKKAGKDKEKIDSDVKEIVDFEYKDKKAVGAIYIKDGKLYKKVEGKEKEKIVSDVDDVVSRFKGESFYYVTEGKGSSTVLMDYVEDDMKEQDEDIQEPGAEPEYPSWFSYSTTEEYQKALEDYNTAHDEYIKARDKYQEKVERDSLREELEKEKVSKSTKELYYYDGKEGKKISDNFVSLISRAYTNPVIAFYVDEEEEVEKVKLSEIEYTYDVYEHIEGGFSKSSGKMAIAVGDEVSNTEQEDVDVAEISKAGDLVYFVADINEAKEKGDLYEIKIKNNKVSEASLYDEDVYSGDLSMYEDGQILYFKDFKDSEGSLYINKKEIDEDVYIYGVRWNYSNKEILYYKDYNQSKEKGSLMIYNGKKSKLIEEDVHDFDILYDGSILYLYDYSTGKYKGELKHYKNGKNKKIDEDVTAIFDYLDYSLAN